MIHFITIDGQHGTGKSYIVDMLYKRLKERGYDVVHTKEPTDSRVGLKARQAENICDARALARLFAIDRKEHCRQLQTWLEGEKIIISDRYIISSLILQNMDGVSFSDIWEMNEGCLLPDLSVILYANQYIIDERVAGKTLTRLAKQERKEHYDRYLLCKQELMKWFTNIWILPNNTKEDGERIIQNIVRRIEE